MAIKKIEKRKSKAVKRASTSQRRGEVAVKKRKKVAPAKRSVAKAKKATKNVRVAKTAQFSKRTQAKKVAVKRANQIEQKSNRLMSKGRERGFVTYDEILKEFPTIEDDILFLEELYERFNVASIDVLEGGGMLEDKSEELMSRRSEYRRGESTSTHDSIQMYLREMWQYQLLNAQEQRDLAKRVLAADVEATT